jgi:ureidoglycolate hydrolase
MESRLSPFYTMEQQELNFLLMLHESLLTFGTDTAYKIVNRDGDEDESELTYEEKYQLVDDYIQDLDIVIQNKFKTLSQK